MVTMTYFRTRILWAFATLSAVSLLQFRGSGVPALVRAEEPTCYWSSCDGTERDPALKEFTYDVGDGPQTTTVYVEPELNSFYQKPSDDDDDTSKKRSYSRVKPAFNGLAGKFINMSNRPLNFYWESSAGGIAHLMRHYTPFSTGGTGTFPGHRFFLSEPDDPDDKLNLWIIGQYPENLYVYDPYLVEDDPEETEKNLRKHLSKKERSQYDMWKKTLSYNEQYKAFTGRSYLANYGENGPRAPPTHYMWRADYFGQQHWVTTKETHFVYLPPMSDLKQVQEFGSRRVLKDSDPRHFQEYRAKDGITQEPLDYMNMTMKVISCAPRVFEITNFLSRKEVDHILQLAGGISMAESTTGDVGSNSRGGKDVAEKVERKTKVRTSKNSWVAREKTPIIDAIYRRAADLTRIDEALLRRRSDDEVPEVATKSSVSETLQLVHYDETQEYTAHHDFGYSHIDDNHQGARFATILFYLNDDMVGGETAFPRWINGKSFHELKVKPEVGKAILFYDQLPDGNYDDFSQHSAKPIIRGEKWLINLWIWDPTYEH
jgi:prolyl 4-hydroxylase